MNLLRTLFTAAMLVAVLYGVYWIVNHNPDVGTLAEVAQSWNNSLSIEPGSGASGPSSPAPEADVAPPFAGGGSPPKFEAVAVTATAPTFPDASPPTAPSLDATPSASATPPPSASPRSGVPSPGAPQVPSWASSGSPVVETPAGTTDGELPRVLASPPNQSAGSGETLAAEPQRDFKTFMEEVQAALARGALAEAHLMLSRRHGDPSLSPVEAAQVEHTLDQLAGTVIYSPEHYLEQPYRVQPSDTLESIAQQYNVPVGLLTKINGLDPNNPLQPGQQLKVVRGPFDATVDVNNRQMTLMLAGERYAGRFHIGIGPHLGQNEGTFMVTDKADLTALSSAENSGLGSRWIGLGKDLGIHGTDQPQSISQDTAQGCISLGQRDIEDLYDILSIGSKVIIRR